jgi:hypothetical protein
VIDPYAGVNERIRGKRRSRGRRDDEFDRLIRAASQELGSAAEAALGLFVDVAERVGLRYLEEAARTGGANRMRWAPEAVRAARFATSRLPAASGRAVSGSSEWGIRMGLSALRELRKRLETIRRKPDPGEDRDRRSRRRGRPRRPGSDKASERRSARDRRPPGRSSRPEADRLE